MEALITLIIDNGIGIVCVAVVIYDHLVNQKKIVEVMEKITQALHGVWSRLTRIEDKLDIESEETDIWIVMI